MKKILLILSLFMVFSSQPNSLKKMLWGSTSLLSGLATFGSLSYSIVPITMAHLTSNKSMFGTIKDISNYPQRAKLITAGLLGIAGIFVTKFCYEKYKKN